MRDTVVNKVRSIPQITEGELMTVLRTIKEEHMVSLRRDIADATNTATS
jgi:hypothetical protein